MKIILKTDKNTKFILRSFIIIFLVFGLSGAFVFQYINKKTKDNITTEIILKSKSANESISKIFEINKTIVEQMAVNDLFINYLKEVKTRNDITTNANYAKVLKNLKNIKATSNQLYLTWVANDAANFFIDGEGNKSDESYNTLERPWRKYALESNSAVFTLPYLEIATNRIVISGIKALREDSNVLGYVVVDVSLDSIPEIMKENAIGRNGLNFLIAGDGTVVYKDNYEEKLLKSVETYLNSKTNKGLTQSASKLDEVSFNGKDYFIYYSSIATTNLSIVQLIDKQEVLQDRLNFMFSLLCVYIGGTIFILIVLFLNIIDHNTIEKELILKATTDSLTGVNNRGYFMEKAHDLFIRAKEFKSYFSVLILDIDHFKNVNDTYGHAIGDLVLKALSESCRLSLRKEDLFGRIGGEEFAVALPNTNKEEAFRIAEKLRKELSLLVVAAENKHITFTVSIGVSMLQGSDTSVNELIKRADDALYSAKNLGRNRVEFK